MGTLWYLKNFRKGLRHQFGRAANALAEAAQDGKSPDVLQQLQRRIEWVETKYSQLVKGRMILRDAPSCVDGVWQKWGGRGGDAEREMTAQEMKWNQRLSAEKEETEWREERARQIAEGAEAVRRARQQRTQLSEPMWVNPPTWCGPPADQPQDVQEETAAGGKDIQLQQPSSPGGRAATASAAQEDVQLQQPRSQQAALGGMRPPESAAEGEAAATKCKLPAAVPASSSKSPSPGTSSKAPGQPPAKRMPRPRAPSQTPAPRVPAPTPARQGASSCRRHRGETPPPPWAAQAPTQPPPAPVQLPLELPPPPPPWREQERLLENTQAERDRLHLRDHGLSASQRASTASFSKDETAQRRHKRSKENAESQARDAEARFEENNPRRSTPGVGTQAATTKGTRNIPRIARLPPDQAADAERTRPTRIPWVVLSTPDEATPLFHEDWTRVEGSSHNPEAWEKELLLRHKRNLMIRETLEDGRPVWYKSTGNSMWPLVQSGDACSFHPVQAVPHGRPHTIPKPESKIDVGDVVFCMVQRYMVQRRRQYIAHIVLQVQDDVYDNEKKYWIGRMDQTCNGWCHREHIFGILERVEAPDPNGPLGIYLARPLPRTVYHEVLRHMNKGSDGWGEAHALTEATAERAATAD